MILPAKCLSEVLKLFCEGTGGFPVSFCKYPRPISWPFFPPFSDGEVAVVQHILDLSLRIFSLLCWYLFDQHNGMLPVYSYGRRQVGLPLVRRQLCRRRSLLGKGPLEFDVLLSVLTKVLAALYWTVTRSVVRLVEFVMTTLTQSGGLPLVCLCTGTILP